MKFSACDAPAIALRRAARTGFLTHLSPRERQAWGAFQGDDGACYLRFAPQGGPVLWMREESDARTELHVSADSVIGVIAPTPRPAKAMRMPRPASRTVLVGRYGSRQLFVYAGARAR